MSRTFSSVLQDLGQQVRSPITQFVAFCMAIFFGVLGLIAAPYIWHAFGVLVLCLCIFAVLFPLCIKVLVALFQESREEYRYLSRKPRNFKRVVELFVIPGTPDTDAAIALLETKLPELEFCVVKCPSMLSKRHRMPFLRDNNYPYYGLGSIDAFVQNELIRKV